MKFMLPKGICLFTVCLFLTSFTPLDYTGNNLLLILDTGSTTKEFKAIKDFWLLDKNLQNEYGGIKLTLNNKSRVQSILIAGENFQQNGTKFTKCSSALPFNLLLTDDNAVLNNKFHFGFTGVRKVFSATNARLVPEARQERLRMRV